VIRALLALVTALTLGGCTVSQLRSGNDAPGSILRGNAITLDLRRPPTRADVGFTEGRNDRSYQREGPDLETTVLLPGGVLRAPAFVVSADGNDYTPAGRTQPRQPERIVVERVFGSAAEAADSLTADAALLGLDRADLALLLSRVDAGKPPAMPQHGSLRGFVHGWLAVSVDVIGQDDPSVQVNYVFTVHEYHNPAVDKVVHGGVFGIDLTRRPSRAELAFRDTYSVATVRAEPGAGLTAQLKLADGVLSRAVSDVTSTTTAPGVDDPAGAGQPRRTTLTLGPSSVAGAEHTLRTDAALLGLDPHAVEAVFAGSPGTFVSRTLTGDSTEVYAVSVKVEVTLGQPGGYAASLRYDLTYR
jgi:hypothetical protein